MNVKALLFIVFATVLGLQAATVKPLDSSKPVSILLTPAYSLRKGDPNEFFCFLIQCDSGSPSIKLLSRDMVNEAGDSTEKKEVCKKGEDVHKESEISTKTLFRVFGERSSRTVEVEEKHLKDLARYLYGIPIACADDTNTYTFASAATDKTQTIRDVYSDAFATDITTLSSVDWITLPDGKNFDVLIIGLVDLVKEKVPSRSRRSRK